MKLIDIGVCVALFIWSVMFLAFFYHLPALLGMSFFR